MLLLAEELEARARTLRKVAAGLISAEARRDLESFADEYERRAAALRRRDRLSRP